MNSVELNIRGNKISLYGTKQIVENEKSIIENLNLTGNEANDRLIIQNCIDENNLKSDILYAGNTVYPLKKIIKEYRKLQKSDSLENMSNYMYKFFIGPCGDIAHYDIYGFRGYYNNSLVNLENKLLSQSNFIPYWNSDVDKIFKVLKIGKYFNERDFINVNEISINKLKSIIKECGWELNIKNNIWELKGKSIHGDDFSFSINVENKQVSDIVSDIQAYYDSFDVDIYSEEIIDNRENNENKTSISSIVSSAYNIKGLLYKFSSNILYKSRLAVEEINDKSREYNSNTSIENDEYDLDICG